MDSVATAGGSTLPPTPRRSSTGSGRPYPPETIAAVRALIVGAGLSRREAAARSGLREDTIGKWARRYGWRRAGGAGDARVGGARVGGASATVLAGVGPGPVSLADHANLIPPHPEVPAVGRPRSTQDRPASFEAPLRGAPQDEEEGGRRPDARRISSRHPGPYGPAVREAARVRVEGSRDGLERIADELGIARWTLHRWRKRFGWRRPAPPERGGPAGPGFFRSRRFGRAYGADAVGTARDLVTRSNLPLGRIAARAGVSRATVYRWMARRGWTRPVARGRRRYRPPYGPAVMAAARALYEQTELSTRMIASRAKTTPERVAYWARTGGWTRPREMPDPHGRVRRRRAPRRRDPTPADPSRGSIPDIILLQLRARFPLG